MTKDLIFVPDNRASCLHRIIWALSMVIIALLLILNRINKQVESLQVQTETIRTDDRAAVEYLMGQVKHYKDMVDKQHAYEKNKINNKNQQAMFIHSEINCLAENIYHEAAYEPENGQLAVATVTMNRVADSSYPKTICGVVYERHIKKNSDKMVCAFSWTCKSTVKVYQSLYKRALAMARAVYFKHERNEDVADATLYYASYIQPPNWADSNNLVAMIGQHIFYRE